MTLASVPAHTIWSNGPREPWSGRRDLRCRRNRGPHSSRRVPRNRSICVRTEWLRRVDKTPKSPSPHSLFQVPRRRFFVLSYSRGLSFILVRRLNGLMSIHTWSIYSRQLALVPATSVARHPGGMALALGQIEYCSSWLITTT